jgi:hypothetical protein
VGELRISYIPRQDATPQKERAVLASVYLFAIQRFKEKAAESSGGEDNGRKECIGSPAKHIILGPP